MKINDKKEQFNFLKSLDIVNINAEVENLHPSTHKFWENATIKKEFMHFLKDFSKNKKAYTKQTLLEVDVVTEEVFRWENEDIEVGFVNGLFELYKLRKLISTTKGEIQFKKWSIRTITNLIWFSSLATLHSDRPQ